MRRGSLIVAVVLVLMVVGRSWALEETTGTFTFHSGATSAANGTAMDVTKYNTVTIYITGISGDTITFEVTVDGTNWVAKACAISTTGALSSTATANAAYQCNVAGYAKFRPRISTYGSGTITVTGRASTALASAVASGGAPSGTGTSDRLSQWTGTSTLGNSAPAISSDGTNWTLASGKWILPAGSASAPSLELGSGLGLFQRSATAIGFATSGASRFVITGANVALASAGCYTWSSTSDPAATSDVLLCRDAAGVLALRNGTNKQVVRFYSTFTDTSNLEYLQVDPGTGGSGTMTIGPVTAGTGADNISLNLTSAGTGTVKANGVELATVPLGLQKPSSTGAGSTYAHEGAVTISEDTSLGGPHFYTTFVLQAGKTITCTAGQGGLKIIASVSIEIYGTIDCKGAQADGNGVTSGGVGSTANGTNGSGARTDQQGGSGGGGGTGTGGLSLLSGFVGIGWTLTASTTTTAVNTAGANANTVSNANLWMGQLSNLLGLGGGTRGGGGGGDGTNAGGNGGLGGGTFVADAPSITLGAACVIDTRGNNGSPGTAGNTGGGGGGGAGNAWLRAHTYTDNGCTFIQTAATGGAGSGTGGAGGNGAAGMKQIMVY